jgi:opacity protein-like surface antigen
MRSILAPIAMLVVALSAQQASAQLYVRGDLGGAFSTNTDVTDVNSSASNALLGPGVRISGDSGNSVIFGAGVGGRITPLFRADATLSYMPSFQFRGTDNLGLASTETADIDSFVGLVNGYVDFNGLAPNMFGGFQPYVDAGIGFAVNHVGTTHASLFGATATLSDETHTSFAWGAGAGVAYAIQPNILLDLAYKYLDLGEVRTGTTLNVAGVTAQVGAAKAGLQAHTVTLGVRVSF